MMKMLFALCIMSHVVTRHSVWVQAYAGRFCNSLHSVTRPRARLFLSASSRASSSSADSNDGTVSSSSTSTPTPVFKNVVANVILKRSPQSKAFRNGNQLVFTRAIERFESSSSKQPDLAELVQVLVDVPPKEGQKPVALGYGVYNPDSLYKVRLLCHRFLQPRLFHAIGASADETTALRHILNHHFRNAVSTRRALDLPSTSNGNVNGVATTTTTDTYRLVNGEGDQLSGLAVDIVGGKTAVVMSSAAWCEIHRNIITECLQEQLFLPNQNTRIVWKTTPNRLRQDGFNSSLEEDDNSSGAAESDEAMVISTENGIKYQTYPYSDGQKTGVYCDQRENRWNIAQLCRNKRVLDLCCFHGGFSLNAVVNGGALACTGVDSSQDAIDACLANAELNNCLDKVNFVRSDITAFLQESAGQAVYDVIVLDPPKLAPSVAGLDKARRKYHSFNRDAIKVVAPEGGLLLTCTCSAAMTQKDGGQYFLSMVQGAAQATNRQVTLLRVSGAASCHTQSPVSWPAGAYLTAALFYVHPVE